MAEEQIPQEVEDNISRSIGEEVSRPKKRQPTYQVLGDSKIPVSSKTGEVWKDRLRMGQKGTESVAEAWSEAMRYYNNDQMGHRLASDDVSGNTIGNQRLNDNITQSENVVFSNVTTMVPALYARNPKVEFSTGNEASKEQATMVERLVNDLLVRKSKPGVGLKKKAKRCIVTTLLTNRSWLTINWISKEDSSEQALVDLQNLAKKLEKAKDAKAIREVEGQIMALEDTIDALSPSGPEVKFKLPTDVVVDPAAMEIDGSDAHWMIVLDYLPTSFLKAKYANKVKDEYKSIFQPSHVMKLGDKLGDEHEDVDFSLFKDDSKAKDFGFEDETSFEKAQMTRVAFVWDKVTRRVLLFNMKDWKWPIWVWDDPLRLDTFFPCYPLVFFESPAGPVTKGEVSYYLDQADAINEISDEMRRARRWARRNIFFDSNRISPEDAQAVLNGDDGTARGVDLPEGAKITDLIFSMPPPSLQFKDIFDKEGEYAAVDRISSVGEVLRGSQFKTNTTNRAVDANVSASNMRIDEKSDEIEDWIGCVAWGIAQLCLMNMDQETVSGIIGQEAAAEWTNMTPEEIRSTFTPRVVGGTSKKPTSKAKKEEALELGQVLGQFVSISPTVVIIMLKVMQEAFDEVTITEEEWQQIIDSIQTPPQQQGQAPQQEGGQAGGGEPAPEQQLQKPNEEQINQILSKMPDEAKQAVVALIQQGMPPQEALQQVVQAPPQQSVN